MIKQETELSDRFGHTYLQWAFAILANTYTLSYGLECGWTSPVTKILQSASSPTGGPLTDLQVSWIASAMSMAAVVGVPIFSRIAERFGSKVGMMLLAPLQVVAWAIRIFYSTGTTLLVARIITGMAAGGVFVVVPMYVKEISQDSVRGVLGSLLVLAQNMGIFIMYVMGASLDYYTVMYISISLPIATTIIMMKAPHSPAFLVKQQKTQDASNAIALLRGLKNSDEIVQSELKFLQTEDEQFKSLPDISFKMILKDKSLRRGLILILTTFTFHGVSGAFAIITFASAILVSTGVEINMSPELQTLSIPFVMIISSLMLTAIIERCGRKLLLAASFLIMSISMCILAVAILAQKAGWNVPSWLPILAMVLVVAMYAGGISPLPYIVMTEMFNFQVRAKVMGNVVTWAWFLSFVSVVVYAPIAGAFGQQTAFFLFGSFNLIGAIFVFTCLIETRGKNDEDIRRELRGSRKLDEIEK